MNNTCLNIQEQIPELLADALPTEQTAELHEHISTCADCRRYLEALQADDNLLGEFIESMQPTLARLEKNVIDSLGRGRQNIKAHTIPIWRTIMKSRIIKIAVAAMIIISTAIVVQHFGVAFRTTTITYGMTNLPDLLNDTQTLHVQSTCWIYRSDPNQPEFEEATVIPCEVWIDVPNLREHFISFMSWSTQDGKKGLNLVEGVRDQEYAMDIDHTKKTVRFNKVSLVERRMANKNNIQRYLNRIIEEELEYFVIVGQETINGTLYDIWERQDADVHDSQTLKRIKCWMSPVTGELGRMYIWRKTEDEKWRLTWCADTIERDIDIPDSIFEFDAPENYKYNNELETAYDSGLGGVHFYIGGVRFGMPINFTLDDGSVIVAWHCEDKQANGFQEQEHLFKDLVPGGELPKLPMVIYGLKTIPRETYSPPVIHFIGRHLAYTRKGDWHVEWAVFVPEEPLPASSERRGYRMLCEFNLEIEQQPQEGNPLSENRIDADEFDLLVRAAMAELNDDGTVPEHVTYQNVMELAQQIRASINQ